jgi:hypothetical protein
VSLDQIRTGLVANLRAAYPTNVQIGKYVMSAPTPPTLQIRHGGIDYDRAMGRGLDELTLVLQGVAHRDETGQMLVDEWAGSAGGVKEAVEADKLLGGAVNDLRVTAMAEPFVATVGGMDVLVAEWTITLYPEGDV